MASVGFSTGAIAYEDFRKALELLAPTRASAVELSALRSVELPGLLEALPSLLDTIQNRYAYISFHAPTDFSDEAATVEQLLPVARRGLNIVVHPDCIQDKSLWHPLGKYLCIENMDSRKSTGRTASELVPYFADLPHAKLCFDIAHARQVDPTMTEAACILREFGCRLAQVHMSEINSRGKHFAMSFGAKQAYKQFSAELSQVPIILESVVDNPDIGPEIDAAIEIATYHTPHFAQTESSAGCELAYAFVTRG